MSKTVVSIQYLRGLAVMLVVYHHSVMKVSVMSMESFIPYSGFGNAGVDIFFIISGFIMWVTTTGRVESPIDFWYRRIVRIVPLYWFFTLAIVVPKLFVPGLLQSVQLSPGHVLKSLVFIPHYHPVASDQIWPILIPGWTLNYEMFFYLLFGGALFFAVPKRLPLLTAAFSSLVIVGLLITLRNPVLLTYTNELLLEFLSGVVFGALYTRGITWKPATAILMVVFSIVLFTGFESVLLPEASRVIAWGVPALLLIGGTLSLERTRNIQRFRFFSIGW